MTGAYGESFTEYLTSAGAAISEFGTYDSGSGSTLAGDTFSLIYNANGSYVLTVNDITGKNGSSYVDSYSNSSVLLSQSGAYDSGALAGDVSCCRFDGHQVWVFYQAGGGHAKT